MNNFDKMKSAGLITDAHAGECDADEVNHINSLPCDDVDAMIRVKENLSKRTGRTKPTPMFI